LHSYNALFEQKLLLDVLQNMMNGRKESENNLINLGLKTSPLKVVVGKPKLRPCSKVDTPFPGISLSAK
jgi:hypothetical protein